jgi:endonuclease G
MPQKRPSNILPPFIICLVLLAILAAGTIWYLRAPPPAPVLQAAQDYPFIFGGLPQSTAPDSKYTLLTNIAYIDGYSEARADPIFTAYHLKGQPRTTTDKRPGTFHPDIRTADKITTKDYTNSGFDRGHMSPNHVIDEYFGPEAQLETFLMSNVVPQRHTLNAGVWEKIEALESDTYEPKLGEMWVIIGPVFADAPQKFPTGINIPDACFRIWVRNDQGSPHVLAFLCPNEGLTGKELPPPYISTVKEIEDKTHLDFFDALPAGEKSRLETEKTGLW